MFEVGVFVVRASAIVMFVFKLHQDDAASTVNLVFGHDLFNLGQMPVRQAKKGRATVADGHAGLAGEPGRKPAVFPFAARVGSNADNRIQAHFVNQSEPGIEVKIIGEVPLAFFAFRNVPENIRLQAIEPHLFGPPDAVAPEFPGDAGVMHFSRGEKSRLAIDVKIALFPVHGTLGGGLRRVDVRVIGLGR